jgi:hypothetical protein
LECSSNVDTWAREKCSSSFVTKRISDMPGGACGYSVYQVTCSSPR